MKRSISVLTILLMMMAWILSVTQGFADEKDPEPKKPQKPKKERPPFRWVNPLKDKSLPGVRHATFQSPSMKIPVGYCIYLPPDYDKAANAKKRYPVVYYLHGGRPGSEIKSVRLAPFMDKAIRAKQIKPTIYVFVNGGPVSHYNYPEKKNGMGEDVFIKELIPHVEKTYRVIADQSGRALEGFSQGGRGTARIALKHRHLFCSAASGGGGHATEKRISENDGRESEALKFAPGYNTWDLAKAYAKKQDPGLSLMIFVGTKGFNYENNLEYAKFLKSLKIPFEMLIVEDAPHSAKIIYDKRGLEVMKFHQKNFERAQSKKSSRTNRDRVEFTRLIAHWAKYADDDYLKFVEEAKPEICQIGFYGGHFYSLVHTPQYKGYPAHFPLQGIDECGKWHEARNSEIHKRGAKVVGHFNVTFLVGEPEGENGPRGFFKFYRELWNEKELGPRPVKDPLDLIAKNADGSPMRSKNYSIGGMREYTACLNNPHWRAVMKAWTKRGIERGVDGFQINYFYRHNCLCEHCQSGFREYLAKRFTAEELKAKFEISDVKTHKFTEIVGWHNPKESTELRREMLRWSQMSCKNAFDDVFVKYGRALKPDLILSQWNHLGNFSQIRGDERCMLPGDLWGRDEDYLWYSTGGSAYFTDLKEGNLGEGTLQARYIRGAFDDKPFTLGKYESTRTRVAISELAANGGHPWGSTSVITIRKLDVK